MRYLPFIIAFLPIISVGGEPTVNEIDEYSHEISKGYQLNGYIYQGYQKSERNNYIGTSSSPRGSLADREIGLTWVYPLSSHTDIKGSAKVEHHGDEVKTVPEFNYLFLDSSEIIKNTRVGFRVGQVRNVIGFYNATMDSPVARDTDVAPQSIYRDSWKHILISGVGYQLYTQITELPLVNLNIDYSVSEPNFTPKEDILASWFVVVPTGNFDIHQSRLSSVSLSAVTKDLSWAFRYDNYKLIAKYISGPDDFRLSGDYGVGINVIGVRHYMYDFVLTYEHAMVDPEGDGWNSTLFGKTKSEATNFVLKYQHSQKLSYSLGLNRWISITSDPSGEAANKETGLSPENFFYTDNNISFKYNPVKNWIFKGSYHHIKGSAVINNRGDNPHLLYNSPATDRRMTLSVTYAF